MQYAASSSEATTTASNSVGVNNLSHKPTKKVEFSPTLTTTAEDQQEQQPPPPPQPLPTAGTWDTETGTCDIVVRRVALYCDGRGLLLLLLLREGMMTDEERCYKY